MRESGKMPLPPYLRKAARDDQLDENRYQTVFAAEPGAVAAPTAALHFTPGMLEAIKSMGVQIERITLHVGLGTFRPVKAERVEDHVMHEEKFRISRASAQAVKDARAANRRIVAAGTTAVRALESFFSRGEPEPDRWHSTRLFILPGYRFRMVDAMLTNFHLPRSTLLMLACAFAGCKPRRSPDDGGGDNNIEAGREFLLRAYAEAIRLQYRFYSYGDAMFIQ
jgi:S-adenosylmethionine:tRNA ribosyltransferase-isomerase